MGEDSMIPVKIIRLPHAADLPLPAYAHPGDAGADLCAAIDSIVPAGGRVMVQTGIAVALPIGYELQIRPRSGLAAKHGITVLNSPGTIDATFRGEIRVILHNTGGEPFAIKRGDRIAQAVLAPVLRADWWEVETLDETERGTGGFGSSGA